MREYSHAMLALLALFLLHPQDPAALLETPSLWDDLSLTADGRLRGEGTYKQPTGDDRYRGRLRVRLAALYQLTPEVTTGARIATTSGDPNNPHADFGSGEEGLGGSELRLDRFFVEWSPREAVSLTAGQFAHAFSAPPIFDEVVWDVDVQPAGAAAVIGPGRRSGIGYDVRSVAYVAVENADKDDAAMVGAQVNLYADGEQGSSIHLATSLMDWSHLAEGAAVLDNQGNTDVAGNFLVWDGFVTASVERGPLGRTTAFVQGMHNFDDSTGQDDGYAAGLMFGSRWRAGATNVFASYYDLDANAIYSPPAQDATPIGGTGIGSGMQGIFAGVEYWVTDTFSLELTVLTSDASAADDPVRIRFDLDFLIR